jgi:hypothetical protein
MATLVPPEGVQAEHEVNAHVAPPKESAALHTRDMPVRYALVVVGSGLLMLGIPLSAPMGRQPARPTASSSVWWPRPQGSRSCSAPGWHRAR